MPNAPVQRKGLFDRFAECASLWVAKAPFFIFCLLLVILWGPSYFIFGSVNTWELIINTVTTIVTFLLVALLQNSQQRFENVMNGKLNAVADGLGDLMEHVANNDSNVDDRLHLMADVHTLRQAVGLEEVQGV